MAEIPAGMHKVTKAKFYATIGLLDVHPHPYRNETHWRHRGGRLAGWVSQGYCGPFEYGNVEIIYAVF